MASMDSISTECNTSQSSGKGDEITTTNDSHQHNFPSMLSSLLSFTKKAGIIKLWLKNISAKHHHFGFTIYSVASDIIIVTSSSSSPHHHPLIFNRSTNKPTQNKPDPFLEKWHFPPDSPNPWADSPSSPSMLDSPALPSNESLDDTSSRDLDLIAETKEASAKSPTEKDENLSPPSRDDNADANRNLQTSHHPEVSVGSYKYIMR